MPTLTTEEARELGKRRHSLDAYIKSIVARAPELTPEQRSKLSVAIRTYVVDVPHDAAA